MPDRLNGSHQGWVPEARSEFGGIVDDDLAARRAHAVDASPLAIKRSRAGIETALPAAVVRPRSTAEVSRVVTWAAARSVPIVSWGAGSSVTGAPLPAEDALVLDLRGLERILEIDAYGGRVVVEAGVLGGVLERELALQSLTTRMSPQSLERSTVGGWVATRATGQFSSRWGGIEHAVASLTVVLADGGVGRLGTPPRGAVGPDLIQLFIGSEGAFGVVTEVGLRLYPLTRLERLGAYALSDVETGLEAIRRMMALGLRPAVVRLYDTAEALHLTLPEPGTARCCSLHSPALPRSLTPRRRWLPANSTRSMRALSAARRLRPGSLVGSTSPMSRTALHGREASRRRLKSPLIGGRCPRCIAISRPPSRRSQVRCSGISPTPTRMESRFI